MNGWKNHQTWNVSLWLQNEENVYNRMLERLLKLSGNPTSSQAKAIAIHAIGNRTPDNVPLNSPVICWSEIAEMMAECK